MFEAGSQFRSVLYGSDSFGRVYSLVWQLFLISGDTPLSFGEVTDDIGEILADWADTLSLRQSDEFVWAEYSVQTLDDSTVSGKLALPGGTVIGQATADMLPAQTALGISCATGVSRRILKKFVPAYTESATDTTGNWNGTVMTSDPGRFAYFIAPNEATNGLWRWSYNNPDFPPGERIVFPIALKVMPEPHVQRRRRLDA